MMREGITGIALSSDRLAANQAIALLAEGISNLFTQRQFCQDSTMPYIVPLSLANNLINMAQAKMQKQDARESISIYKEGKILAKTLMGMPLTKAEEGYNNAVNKKIDVRGEILAGLQWAFVGERLYGPLCYAIQERLWSMTVPLLSYLGSLKAAPALLQKTVSNTLDYYQLSQAEKQAVMPWLNTVARSAFGFVPLLMRLPVMAMLMLAGSMHHLRSGGLLKLPTYLTWMSLGILKNNGLLAEAAVTDETVVYDGKGAIIHTYKNVLDTPTGEELTLIHDELNSVHTLKVLLPDGSILEVFNHTRPGDAIYPMGQGDIVKVGNNYIVSALHKLSSPQQKVKLFSLRPTLPQTWELVSPNATELLTNAFDQPRGFYGPQWNVLNNEPVGILTVGDWCDTVGGPDNCIYSVAVGPNANLLTPTPYKVSNVTTNIFNPDDISFQTTIYPNDDIQTDWISNILVAKNTYRYDSGNNSFPSVIPETSGFFLGFSGVKNDLDIFASTVISNNDNEANFNLIEPVTGTFIVSGVKFATNGTYSKITTIAHNNQFILLAHTTDGRRVDGQVIEVLFDGATYSYQNYGRNFTITRPNKEKIEITGGRTLSSGEVQIDYKGDKNNVDPSPVAYKTVFNTALKPGNGQPTEYICQEDQPCNIDPTVKIDVNPATVNGTITLQPQQPGGTVEATLNCTSLHPDVVVNPQNQTSVQTIDNRADKDGNPIVDCDLIKDTDKNDQNSDPIKVVTQHVDNLGNILVQERNITVEPVPETTARVNPNPEIQVSTTVEAQVGAPWQMQIPATFCLDEDDPGGNQTKTVKWFSGGNEVPIEFKVLPAQNGVHTVISPDRIPANTNATEVRITGRLPSGITCENDETIFLNINPSFTFSRANDVYSCPVGVNATEDGCIFGEGAPQLDPSSVGDLDYDVIIDIEEGDVAQISEDFNGSSRLFYSPDGLQAQSNGICSAQGIIDGTCPNEVNGLLSSIKFFILEFGRMFNVKVTVCNAFECQDVNTNTQGLLFGNQTIIEGSSSPIWPIVVGVVVGLLAIALSAWLGVISYLSVKFHNYVNGERAKENRLYAETVDQIGILLDEETETILQEVVEDVDQDLKDAKTDANFLRENDDFRDLASKIKRKLDGAGVIKNKVGYTPLFLTRTHTLDKSKYKKSELIPAITGNVFRKKKSDSLVPRSSAANPSGVFTTPKPEDDTGIRMRNISKKKDQDVSSTTDSSLSKMGLTTSSSG